MKPFKYPVRKAGRPKLKAGIGIGIGKKPEEEMGLIQGRQPGSKEEWRVAVALNKMQKRFLYQFPMWGGRNMRGGLVIDFLILEAPEPIPLLVHGERWHKTELNPVERINLSRLENHFGRVIVLWASELQSIEDALSALRRELE